MKAYRGVWVFMMRKSQNSKNAKRKKKVAMMMNLMKEKVITMMIAMKM